MVVCVALGTCLVLPVYVRCFSCVDFSCQCASVSYFSLSLFLLVFVSNAQSQIPHKMSHTTQGCATLW